MRIIKSKDWEVIERIVSNFKFLESPKHLNYTMQYETERLFDKYYTYETNDETRKDFFLIGNKYRIIYRDDDSINDYEIEVTKITPDYIYGIGGLVKYKKVRIVGLII